MESIEQIADWTVLEASGKMRLARCKCGTTRRVAYSDMRLGKSKGCGCEALKRLAIASKIRNRRHGFADTPTQRSWVEMRRRCYAAHRKEYPNYGGRGIAVCDRWRDSFDNFLADMGPRPDGHTLDRIDNDGHYTRENCRWVPRAAQERNKRSNAIYVFNGERMTVVEAAERYGIAPNALYQRIGVRKWDPSRAVNTPIAPAQGGKPRGHGTTL